MDSSEDSEEESTGDDDVDEGRNVDNNNNDSEDSEDSSGAAVEKIPATTIIQIPKLIQEDQKLFSNVVRGKKTKRTYRRGLSEEEKKTDRREKDKLRREKMKQLKSNTEDVYAKKRTQNEVSSKTYLLSLSKDEEKGAKRRKQESERNRKGRQKKQSARVEDPAGRKADIDSYTPLNPDHTHK
jgi:hypothetical protein